MITIGLDVPHGSNTFPPSKGVYKNRIAYHEHDFGSLVITKAKKRLEALGFKVVMLQKPFSPEVSLSRRTSYYKSQGVDFVWSPHANANSNKDVDGRCAFYWYSDPKAKKAAEIYVDELKKAGYDTHGNGLHASLPSGWTNLHICRVNAQNGIPAILTENGFMSNDQPGVDDDFELIFGSKQDEYTTVIAEIGVKTICRLFGVSYKEDKPVVEQLPGDFSGKQIHVIYQGSDGVNFRNKPDWNLNPANAYKAGTRRDILAKYRVDGSDMFKILGGDGYPYYITAHEKYVEVENKEEYRMAVNKKETGFVDVDKDAYYAEAVKKLREEGIMIGTGENKFGVGENLKREDFAVALVRALKL